MRLVPWSGQHPPEAFKTQWSTTSERFRDVPAGTPESGEWVDRPDHPARRGGGMADPRAGRPDRYRHAGIVPDEQHVEAVRQLTGVVSDRPIPIIYNDADLRLATLAGGILSESGQRPVLSSPGPRLRWTAQLDAEWWQRLSPFLRAADVAVDVAAPGSPPNPAKARELEALRQGRARVVLFWPV